MGIRSLNKFIDDKGLTDEYYHEPDEDSSEEA
jgi:hypothetical protein